MVGSGKVRQKPVLQQDDWPLRLRWTALLLGVLWLVDSASGLFAARALQLIALGPAVVVPLGLALAAVPRQDGRTPRLYVLASVAVMLAAPGALWSLTRDPGPLTAALVVPWSLATALVSLFGLRRLLRRGFRPVEELAIDAGLLYLVVGGVWLLASRAGVSLGGFTEPIVTYTAAHFHFAGFAAPLIAGLVGRALVLRRAPDDPGPILGPHLSRLTTLSLGLVILGVPLVAAGIVLSRDLEMPAAFLLAFGMLVLALLLLRLARSSGGAIGVLLAISGGSLLLSMSMAVWFAATGSASHPVEGAARVAPVPFATMVELHGTANALGFAVMALLAFTLRPPPARLGAEGGSWSRLRSKGRVGADFFERIGAATSVPVEGQLQDLSQLAWRGFHPERVHPDIRRFYEHTAAFQMRVTPTWYAPFRLPIRPFVWLGERVFEQLALPIRADATDPSQRSLVEVRLFELVPGVDGRADARGYVRLRREPTGEAHALFVAAYGTHRGPRTLLSAALPLPFCALMGVLRFDDGPRPGSLVVSSEPVTGEGPGDEGMFLMTPLGPIRLPLDEHILVWEEAGVLRATHRTWLFGLRCFRFEYVLEG